MNFFLKYKLWHLAALLFYCIRKLELNRNQIVWSRTACLGNDSLALVKLNGVLQFNIQKGRIDYLSELILTGKSITPQYENLDFVIRNDIKTLILQQFFIQFKLPKRPFFLLMDSYSELTDQKFVSKKNSNSFFFANYKDLAHSYNDEIKCEGLLEMNEKLYNYYDIFFSEFRRIYPEIPIVFIHFPKKLDERPKFTQRSDFIENTVRKVSTKFDFFFIVEIPGYLVDFNPKDKFPYHYSKSVYSYVADVINKLIKSNFKEV